MLKTNKIHDTSIFIIAGEVSGDMFAADLMKEIQKQIDCHFIGFGGSKMAQEKLQLLAKDNSLLSAVGFVEAGRFVLKHWNMLRKIVPAIKKNNIKHVILVDHEVFNIIAAKRIRRAFGNSVKIYFYIPPRVSMWGAKSAPVIAGLCDALFCYMKADTDIYKQYTPNVFFYGNPLSKTLKSFVKNPNFFEHHNLDFKKDYISIMPGSRKQEIEKLLPVFLKTASRLHIEYGTEFLMAVAHHDLQKKISKEIQKAGVKNIIHIINESSLEIMSHTKIGLVSAGTITLEAVMMNMYPIITYQVSDFTFNMIKKTENLPDNTLLGLPNVFLKERIFPEIIQYEVTPERLYKEVLQIKNMSPELLNYIMHDAKERLGDTLGSTENCKKIADYIVQKIRETN